MNFRLAKADDFDTVMKLMEDVFTDISADTTELYRKSYLKALESENVKQFLLIVDEEIIGHVTITIYHSFYDKGNIMWIDDIAVRKDKRRQGYGSKILEFCLDYAGKNKVVEIFLGANNGNYPAQKLYEKYFPKTDDKFYIKKIREHAI